MSFSSSVFPECEKNSIYFTDDNWDEMNCDYLYGGHDNGIYNLETQAFKTCFEFDYDKFDSPLFWIAPTVYGFCFFYNFYSTLLIINIIFSC